MKRLAGYSLIALFVGSLSLSAQEAPAAHAYYPLKPGSEWTYKVQGGPIKVKVVGTEKVGALNGVKLETSAAGKVSATETVALTPEGVKRLTVNQVSPEAPILFLPADPETTKEWSVDTKVGGQTVKGTFKVAKDKVTVPLATYENAIHVKGVDMEIGTAKTTVEYWFVKDVGIVKLKFTMGSQEATLELETYVAGKSS